MRKSSSPINLFHYLDYRKFLKDWYQAAKKSRGSFSFRLFSKRAGFRSTNFFKLVMEGKRNLTVDSLSKFMKGLNLNKQEQEFFRNLVFFNQAKTHDEKDQYYNLLLQSKKFVELKPIEKHQYDYYSTWYHAVVRELAASHEFDGTPDWLAERINPKITPAQAEKSLQLLEKLGFIQKTANHKWKQAGSIISTGPELKSVALLNYHKSMLKLSQHILDELPSEQRDISALTLGVVKGRLPELKKKIQEFRNDILKLVSVDTHPEEVIQINMQLFPLTKTKEVNSK